MDDTVHGLASRNRCLQEYNGSKVAYVTACGLFALDEIPPAFTSNIVI